MELEWVLFGRVTRESSFDTGLRAGGPKVAAVAVAGRANLALVLAVVMVLVVVLVFCVVSVLSKWACQGKGAAMHSPWGQQALRKGP